MRPDRDGVPPRRSETAGDTGEDGADPPREAAADHTTEREGLGAHRDGDEADPTDLLWNNWDRVDRIFDEALELDPEERPAFLGRACEGRPELLRVLRTLVTPSRGHDATIEAARDALIEDAFVGCGGRDDDLAPGTGVGRYRIGREIARGGMATVYEAERIDGMFQQRVAVKVLHRGLDTDDVVRRFEGEREILSALEHPNIAHILDGGTTRDGRPYLVMELVDGKPLHEWAGSSELSVRDRLELFLEVADAVRYAHARLVIHRDIKPSNVLVTPEGRVKLLDFGIAKILAPGDDQARTTRAAPLTPAYASPEQRRGGRMTIASDVYQLGALLFELLTDSRFPAPVRGAGGGERGPVDRPSEIAGRRGRAAAGAKLRGDIDTIVGKALREDPADRYPSVEALASDVRLHLDGRPITARPSSLGYRSRKFVGRNQWFAPTAALVLLLTAGYVASLTLQASRLERERDRAQRLAAREGALRSLLVGQFGAADPWGTDPEGAADVTMLEALGTAAQQARLELASEPVLLASILSDVAAVHENWDLTSPAIALLEEAMGLREEAGEALSLDQLDDIGLMSMLLSRASLSDSAATLARRRLALERSRESPDQARIGAAIADLARLESAEGRYEEADRLFREAIELSRDADAPPATLAGHLEAHALALQGLEDLDAALASVREALAIRRSLVPDEHPTIAVAEEHLAQVLYAAGRLDESAALHRTALAKMERSLGTSHSTTVATLNNLALVLVALEDHEGAAQVHRRLLRRQLEATGTDVDDGVAISMQNLAATLVRQGILEEADSLAARAVEVFSTVNGPTHYRVGIALLTRADVALRRGDGPLASRLAGQAAEILAERLPPGHIAVAVADCRRAGGLALQGLEGKAEPLALSALDRLRGSATAPPRVVSECERMLGLATSD